MTCIRCQTIEVARLKGREPELVDELYRQIERLAASTVPKAEHDRVLRALEKANELLRRRK